MINKILFRNIRIAYHSGIYLWMDLSAENIEFNYRPHPLNSGEFICR